MNAEEPCEYATREWHAWLAKRHGDVATMNERWGTAFATFDHVPLPSPYGNQSAKPILLDYHRWNQEFLAAWHAMLADAVHAAAPGVPVHAKAMQWTMTNAGDLRLGVDAYLFGRFSNINGNDAGNTYNYDEGDFSQGWRGSSAGIDLQRSIVSSTTGRCTLVIATFTMASNGVTVLPMDR